MTLFWTFPFLGCLLVVSTVTPTIWAQDVKGRSFESQPSRPSPAAYSRQQFQKSFRDENQPEFGQRINRPAVASPENYLHYNLPSDNGIMEIRPRPIIIPRPRPSQQPQQIYNQIPNAESRQSGGQSTPGTITQERQTDGQQVQSNIAREQQPRFFSTSGNVEGRIESQQSRPVGPSADQTQADWNQYMQRYQNVAQPVAGSTGRMYINIGQPRPQGLRAPRPGFQQGTPVSFHPPAPAQQRRLLGPVHRPGGQIQMIGGSPFVGAPLVGAPMVGAPFMSAPLVGSPIQFFQGGPQPIQQQVIRPNMIINPIGHSEPHVAIPIQQNRFHSPISGSISTFSGPIQVPAPDMLSRQIPFNIPAPMVGAPLVHFRNTSPESIQYNSVDGRPQGNRGVVSYQISRANPVITQSEIHTPVFVTGHKPSGEYKYTISQGPSGSSQPMTFRQGSQPRPVHYIPGNINVQRTNVGGTGQSEQSVQSVQSGQPGQSGRYFRLPVETVRTTQSSKPIRNFYVPPYMHPYTHGLLPIQPNYQPMYYGVDPFATSPESQQPRDQVITLPLANDSQNKPTTTVTVEPVSREQEDVQTRVDQRLPSESDYRNSRPNVITVPSGSRSEVISGQPLLIPGSQQSGHPDSHFGSSVDQGNEPKIEFAPSIDEETSEHEPGYGPHQLQPSYPRTGPVRNVGGGWVSQESMDHKFGVEDGSDGITRGVTLQGAAKHKK